VNGESSVHIDRGRWLYRLVLDAESIAIYRSRRAGQELVSHDVWRCLAVVNVSDAFVVEVPGGWQPFVEVADGRHHWPLAVQPTAEAARAAAAHMLTTLADAVAHASQLNAAGKEAGTAVLRAPEPTAAPPSGPGPEAALAHALAEREAAGWHLIYSRQRAFH
jgi:hypothetical protein